MNAICLSEYEIGIDISCQRSKSVDAVNGQECQFVITVCDHARELCPVFPGSTHLHWSLPDSAAVQGPDEERKAAFRKVRDEIRSRLKAFVAEHGSLTHASYG